MAEYPTDLYLNKDKDVFIDASNDLATISGVSQLEQSVALDVVNVTQNFVGEELTGKDVGLVEENVRQSLARDEQVETIHSVEAKQYDRSTGKMTLDIRLVENDDFTIEVML